MVSTLARICFVGAGFGAIIGLMEFVNVMTHSESAPQQAGGYAGAIAWAAIPYCFARCVEKVFAPGSISIAAPK